MELVLHLGVHRTGTTAIQQACLQNTDVLARHNVDFWGPDIMRDPYLQNYVDHHARAATQPVFATEVAATSTETREAIFQCQSEGVKRLVISEENLIGTMDVNFRYNELYPKTLERLLVYRDLFPMPPSVIYISIREYASYWASSYAFASHRNNLESFDKKQSKLVSGQRGWPEILAEISVAFPDSKLIVWQHQNTPLSLRFGLKILLGEAVANAMELSQSDLNAALSAAALEAARHLRSQHPDMNLPDLHAAAKSGTEGDITPFQPFTSIQLSDLNNRYRRDLDRLRNGAVPSLELIDPIARASA